MSFTDTDSPLAHAQRSAFEAVRLLEPRSGIWGAWKPFKGEEFLQSVDRYRDVLYSLEWSAFKEASHFSFIAALTGVVISTIEYYVTTRYGIDDTGECAVFTHRIGQLRVAVEGLKAGLPPNPAKRPRPEDLDRDAEAALLGILVPANHR
jgi:hypothetical protein